jgi:hypothetical protein
MSLLCGFMLRFILIREVVTQNDVPLPLFPCPVHLINLPSCFWSLSFILPATVIYGKSGRKSTLNQQ